MGSFKLDNMCGRYLRFRDFIECGRTYEDSQVENIPSIENSYHALTKLAENIIDPVIEKYGSIHLTYGFASPNLTRLIKGRIAPKLDQHASYELNHHGVAICNRGGAAADFLVNNVGSLNVAKWVVENCPFDRLYFYGDQRPIHVSFGPELNRSIVVMRPTSTSSRLIPGNYNEEKFKSFEER